jgi:hypothetical protein
LCLLTFGTSAIAQELPTPTPIGPKLKLPEGTIQAINKVEYTCYNFEEYKDLLILSNSYQSLYDWRVKTDAIIISWQNLDKIYLERLANRKEQVDTLKIDRTYILKQLEDQRKYILDLQGRKDATVVGWKVVSAIELAAIVALSITMAVK